jgi:hypothetical protein
LPVAKAKEFVKPWASKVSVYKEYFPVARSQYVREIDYDRTLSLPGSGARDQEDLVTLPNSEEQVAA